MSALLHAPSLLDVARAVGDGPLECSTSLHVEAYPSIVWDTNGYYRELGVHPRATRRELREAYQALDGQRSRRLTYILHQLLNPKVRRAYDRTPFGTVFLDDYVAEEMRRRSARESAMARMQAIRRGDVAPDEPPEMVDWDEVIGKTADQPPEEGPDEGPPVSRPWGYSYLTVEDRGHVSFTPQHYESLARRWQAALIEAFGRRGLSVELVVGLLFGARDVTPPCEVVGAAHDKLVVAFLRCDVDDETNMVALTERVVTQATGRWNP